MSPTPRKPRVRKTAAKPRVTQDEKATTTKSAVKDKAAEGTRVKSEVRHVERPEGHVWEITCQGSETVPVAQYANVVVGPIAVKHVALDMGGDAGKKNLRDAIEEVQEIIEDIIEEDRDNVLASVKAFNEAAAAEKKGK